MSRVRWHKRQRELEAAYLVADVVHGRPLGRDKPGAANGTHDFDVFLENGRRIALEVTTAAEQAVLETLAVLHKLPDKVYSSLTQGWNLMGRHPGPNEPGPNVRRLEVRAEPLVRRLELAGLSEFHERWPRSPAQTESEAWEAIQELRDLGVIAGRVITSALRDGIGWVTLGLVGGGGVMDPDGLNLAVEREAIANVEKLERAGADERHLFVWIDSTSFSAELSMWTQQLPATAPDIPASIATVWAATWGPGVSYGSNAARLARVTPPSDWAFLEVPPVHIRAAEGAHRGPL